MNIDEIKEGGLERAWDFSQEQLDAIVRDDGAGYRARSAAHVEAHLEKLGRRVLLQARSRAELGAPCGRCLAPVQLQVPLDFTLTFVPAEEAVGGEGAEDKARHKVAGSFRAEQVDEESYAGHELDLDPVVREQLLLALPHYPLCREGCKGLCPACGQNLNEKECGCDRHVPDPRWAALAKFRTETK